MLLDPHGGLCIVCRLRWREAVLQTPPRPSPFQGRVLYEGNPAFIGHYCGALAKKGKNQVVEKVKASAKNSSSGSLLSSTNSFLAISTMTGEPQA